MNFLRLSQGKILGIIVLVFLLTTGFFAFGADSTSPVISNISISVAEDTATVTWATDEPADSTINYGIVPDFNAYANDTALVTNHGIQLTGLTRNSTYNICIVSQDEAGNRAEDCTRQFVTSVALPIDTNPPVISNIGVTGISVSAATIEWVTDEIAAAQVEYGTGEKYGTRTELGRTLDLKHAVSLTGLSSNTLYHFQIISTDGSGNQSVSNDAHFSTLEEGSENPGPPVISAISPSEITDTSIVISWRTDEPATSQIEYGTDTNYGTETRPDSTRVLSHSVLVSDLLPETEYHARILSSDSEGNQSMSQDYVFTTLPRVVIGSAAVISNVSVHGIGTTGAVITWETDEPATSQVEYGLTSGYGEYSALVTDMTTPHEITLAGLIPNTTYHFRAISSDEDGNNSFSIDTTFQTAVGATDSTAPLPVMDLAIGSVGQTSLSLSWTAPVDDTGVVFYDINRFPLPLTEDNFYGAQVVHQTEITLDDVEENGTERSYEVVGLTPGTLVYFALKSRDSYGNISLISNVASATTLPLTSGGGGGGYPSSGTPITVNDKVPPPQVSDVQAIGLDKVILLSWKNPDTSDFTRVHIMRDENAYPAYPSGGKTVYDGNGTTWSDPNLTNGKTYYYSIFTYDKVPNYSDPIQLSIAPYAERRHYHILSVESSGFVSPLSVTKDLFPGDNDDEVGHVQEILATDPTLYPEGLVTGYFGPRTQAAVKRLQKRYGTPETGTVDAAVRAVLKKFPASQKLVETTSSGIISALAHNLSFGMKGSDVKILQSYLEEQGLLTDDSVTGYFGPKTREAITQFQIRNNISPAAGFVGPLTRAKILENVQSIPGSAQ